MTNLSEKCADLPTPPPELVFLVTGQYEIPAFLLDGSLAAQTLLGILRKNGLDLDEFPAVLDFGCGCGRVIRHFHCFTRTRLHGVDYNPTLIGWCRQNLPFAQFEGNHLCPPLTYAEGQFGFIYALSVFTHLPESSQLLWINELSRVLRPGGYLLMTTHGESYVGCLDHDEKVRFQDGQLVVRYQQEAGTNSCSSFQPVRYVKEKLASGFELVDFVPEANRLAGHQDAYLLRKPINAPDQGQCSFPRR